ncbi:hypothetical protein C8R43DRAFT_955696 [Mycena crocata]|nr:hypothetical protein C8R43DRAFT_955696 [Mycena crocata]
MPQQPLSPDDHDDAASNATDDSVPSLANVSVSDPDSTDSDEDPSPPGADSDPDPQRRPRRQSIHDAAAVDLLARLNVHTPWYAAPVNIPIRESKIFFANSPQHSVPFQSNSAVSDWLTHIEDTLIDSATIISTDADVSGAQLSHGRPIEGMDINATRGVSASSQQNTVQANVVNPPAEFGSFVIFGEIQGFPSGTRVRAVPDTHQPFVRRTERLPRASPRPTPDVNPSDRMRATFMHQVITMRRIADE